MSSVISGEYIISFKSTVVIRETERRDAPGTFDVGARLSFSSGQVSTAPRRTHDRDGEVERHSPARLEIRIDLEPSALWIYERESRVVQLQDAAVVLVLLMVSAYSVLVVATKVEKKIVQWCSNRLFKKKREAYQLLEADKISVA
jgi:hypothetical protein